jgi:hypothetical protein
MTTSKSRPCFDITLKRLSCCYSEQLARQLQAEEDQQAQEALIRRQRELEEQHKAKQPKKVKKKTSCVMM